MGGEANDCWLIIPPTTTIGMQMMETMAGISQLRPCFLYEGVSALAEANVIIGKFFCCLV